jgi:hypothetical protein
VTQQIASSLDAGFSIGDAVAVHWRVEDATAVSA